jgi:hypothetical protein
MMVWPDGGIGRKHKHPFWSKCQHCNAGPGWEQELAFLILNPITISIIFLLLIYWL